MKTNPIPQLTPIAAGFFARLSTFTPDWFSTDESWFLVDRMCDHVRQHEGMDAEADFQRRICTLIPLDFSKGGIVK